MSGTPLMSSSDLSSADLQRFIPLNQVESKYEARLRSGLRIASVRKGGSVIPKKRDASVMHFLLDGEVEIRNSFENRYNLTDGDERCRRALENQLTQQGTVKAQRSSRVLICEQKVIDELLTWSQDYSIHFLEDGELPLAETNLIDDDFHEDWDSVFIQSKLATNISHQAIGVLLAALETIDVSAGDTVVKRGTDADYFYVVKHGEAIVKTDPDGPYHGAEFSLTPGQYFGDEALVANTVRNASVIMGSKGVLGRLDRERFDQLIKSQLIQSLNLAVLEPGQTMQVIDVRFEVESKFAPIANSLQIPVPKLRKQLADMPHDKLYVVAPANDVRSELATYLMRQAGLNAYVQSTE